MGWYDGLMLLTTDAKRASVGPCAEASRPICKLAARLQVPDSVVVAALHRIRTRSCRR